jgi:spore maturation protein SpmB
VIPTTLFATLVSTAVAILAAKLGQRLWPLGKAAGAAPSDAVAPADAEAVAVEAYPAWVSLVILAAVLAVIPLMILYGRAVGPWIMPVLVVGLLGFGMARGVKVYEVFVEGAKEGFEVAVRIIPYLVAILMAVAMFKASGAMDMLLQSLGRLTGAFGVPAEALAMATLRSLSGSGAYGLLASLLKDPAIGPDGYLGMLVSTIYGSTETTFYVLAVYFGAVNIRRIRHALAAGIIADVAGVAAAVAICAYLFA